MPVDTRIQIPFLPQTGITEQILAAVQLANEHQRMQQQAAFQQGQLGLQQQAQPSEIALRQAQTGQLGAQTAETQAQTAAGLPAAQAKALEAKAALDATQNAYEQETNPIKKAQLESQVKLQKIEVDRANLGLQFFGGGATPAEPGKSGFDTMLTGVRTTLGKLAPDEKAVLDAAEQSSRYDLAMGRPDALNHVQQATSEIANNRRAYEVAKLFGQFRGDIYNKEYYNTESGQLEQLTANQFNEQSQQHPNRYIQYSGTVQNTLKAQSLINDIQDGIDNMKKVLNDPKFTLSAGGRALLQKAQQAPEGMAGAVLSGAAAENLSPQEKQYFMAMATLNERAMAMRGLQGQGSGSDQQREAIVRMLPSIATADTGMAKDQLKLFQNNLDNLNKMVPKIGKGSKESAGGASAPKAGAVPTAGVSSEASGYLQSIGAAPQQ